MTSLPIVRRELLAGSRRKATYQNRVWLAIVGIFVGGALAAIESLIGAGRQNSDLIFSVLVWIGLIYVWLDGARLTADAISEERREGTLGLLFLTDLRGLDVVLGKLAANSMTATYALMGLMPVVAVSFLFGGVSMAEFARAALVLVSSLFLTLSIGILISSLTEDAQRALGWILFATGFVVIAPLVASSFAGWLEWDGVARLVRAMSPAAAMSLIGDGSWDRDLFWMSIGFFVVVSMAMLGVTARILPHVWQTRPGGKAKPKERPVGPSPAVEGRRKRRRGHLLELNPVTWLVERGSRERVVIWLFVVLVCVLPTLGMYLDPMGEVSMGVLMMLQGLVNFVLKLGVAMVAVRGFAEMRRNGSLDMIMTTPLREREIIQGPLLAVKRIFLWPVVVVLLFHLVGAIRLLALEVSDPGGMTVVRLVGGSVVLVTDLIALAWAGLWLGLSSAKVNRATANTFGLVIVLPWIIATFAAPLVVLVLGIWNNFAGMGSGGAAMAFAVAPYVLYLIKDIGFILWARSRLLGKLRRFTGLGVPAKRRGLAVPGAA